jgi:predicted GNAT superfamily acetyltransferase
VIEIRALSTGLEFTEAVELQQRIWGFAEIELLPVRLFVVANKVGGHSFGAYDGSRMVGFLLAIPGIKPGGRSYLHSHMLGVLPEYRDLHIGRMLKLRQREDAIARGIELVEWTFDPLELKNAFFNMERLGAIVRRYVDNQYGTTSSPLHGGLPTDRCTAEWWVGSERVQSVIAGNPVDHGSVEGRIEVPADIAEIRKSDPKCAREIQKGVAAQFHRHLDAGLAVVGVERTPQAGIYLFGRLP